jgi:glycosyltransferase involved in cell wall biosynthesis
MIYQRAKGAHNLNLIKFCLDNGVQYRDVAYETHKPIKGKSGEEKLSKMLSKSNFLQLVAITSVLGNYYRNKFDLTEDKLKIAPDAADLPLSINQTTTNKSGRPKAGYAGHLYPGKGVELISELVKRCPEVDFHIVGGTKEDIIYWRDYLRSYENVLFHGFVSHSLIGRHLQSFDILLAPYLEKVSSYSGRSTDISRWMSPLKLFEYMAACKPIICSDLPVLREVINNGENALLCPPNDINSWVKALALLIKDPDYSQELATNAYNDFIENYTWNGRVNNILNRIESVKNKLNTKQG